ncbi:Ricin-type beta-trefoil lectin domain-containing protein [Streptomyces sp. yr375]|uniref:RICIN domain-containing protein n=1 Tax=Streptomyces sp. yr375 TaxID=1761906 RepID=UPI0008BE72DC|nr:RICIN domain-containing protein [Streptomyces sp. yr375]SEP88118.1 Ricin-type beta-trefoil lectin domain-containing protein [Streptomyces sp. yr375]
MHSPNPPRPPYPPRPGWTPGDSDPQLAARLADSDERSRAVALLFARHWQAAHDYATVCLAGTEDTGRLVAAAAFHEVLGRLADGRTGGGALRPQLLVAVRETVRKWAGADGVSAVLPELRKTTGGRGLRAARPVTPERRQLAERAFQLLPTASQCLLWHTEVEAELISVPAGLSGVDGVTATAVLEQAREQFRAGVVRAHRELAPTSECRFHSRLLDVPLRRGGTLLPDVREHLAHCRFCRHAAEQLSHFDGGLDVLLAETVLGWGARRYLESRPGRLAAADAPARPDAARQPGGARQSVGVGRHRTAVAGVLDLPVRRPKAVLVGVGLTSLALVATVFVATGWSDGGGAPAPGATWGAPVGGPNTPGVDGRGVPGGSADTPPAGFPTSASASGPASRAGSGADSGSGSAGVAQGSLRSPDTGYCLDAAGGRTEAGVGIVLAACSSAASQQWSYQEDGELHSAAAPTLCLTADPGRRTTALASCLVHAGETFFDLTVRGELLLRQDGDLVVARRADGSRTVVVATRDGSAEQRWVFDRAAATAGPPGPEVRQAPQPPAPGAQGNPPAPGVPGSADRPAPPAAPGAPPRARDAAPAPGEPAPSAPEFRTRSAQVDCCDSAPASPAPAGPAVSAVLQDAVKASAEVPRVVGALGETVANATKPLGT